MHLIRDSKKQLAGCVIAIGNFDGVHKGHQELLAQLATASHDLKLPSVVLTFEPHPKEFFSSGEPLARLMRFSEKWKAIHLFSINYLYCMRFNRVIANLSANDFIKTILVDQLHVKKIIVGDDFRFGAKRLGDVALLKSLEKLFGFTVDALSQTKDHHARISSTRVRDALQQADFKTVMALTGRSFTLSGKVSYGNQLGRQLGFPTANIHLHRKQVPLMGIFVVRVHGIGPTTLNGVASIGYRPTFNGKKIVLEVFIFNFDEMIYGHHLTVEFLHKIRDEEKFESADALVIQMKKDVAIASDYLLLKDGNAV